MIDSPLSEAETGPDVGLYLFVGFPGKEAKLEQIGGTLRQDRVR